MQLSQRRSYQTCFRNQPDIIKDIVRNNIFGVKRLLNEKSVEANYADQSMRTPLHLAAALGRSRILELLATSDAYSNVNPKDSDMLTPLHLACRYNHIEAVEVLVAFNADVNARSRLNVTPLHVCAAFNSYDCARLLLNQVNNINFSDSFGTTALHVAVHTNSHDVLDLLLQRGALANVQDKHGQRPMHYAAIADNVYGIKMLVEHGYANVNVRNKDLLTPLHFAIAFRNQNAFFGLLDVGAHIDSKDINGNRPAHWAAYMGHEGIFAEIQRCMAAAAAAANDIVGGIPMGNNEGMHPLHYACLSGDSLEVAVRILDHDPASLHLPDKHGRTPLHFAALSNLEALVVELLERGARSNALDSNRDTPLHKAHVQSIIEVLINAGPEQLKMTNNEGFTPLHLAVISALPLNCKLLIDSGADPLIPDASGRTPHFFCVIKGNQDCFHHIMNSPLYVEKIASLEEAAAFNIMPLVDSFGRSILHYAAASTMCSHEFLEFLLGKSVLFEMSQLDAKVHQALTGTLQRLDLNQRDMLGRTPLHYLCMRAMGIENDVMYLVESLVGAGANIGLMDESNRLPFHYAVTQGYKSTLQCLLQPNWINNHAQYVHFFRRVSPLKLAARYDQVEVLQELLALGFDQYGPAILLAAQHCNWNCVLKLLKYAQSADMLHRMAMIAALNGSLSGLQILTNSKVDLDLADHHGRTPVFLASLRPVAASGKPALKYVVNHGGDIHMRDNQARNALFYAVADDYHQAVEFLLAQGVRFVTDAKQKTIMHLIFAKNDDPKVLDMVVREMRKRHMLEQACYSILAHKDYDGLTPLQIGIIKHHNNLVAYCLGNLRIFDDFPLMNFAAFVGNYNLMCILPNDRSNVDGLDVKKRTVLHYACLSPRNNEPMIKFLLDNGKANYLTRKDDLGFTPLLCAAYIGNWPTIAYLLANTDANPLEVDGDENTILHLACDSGDDGCATRLLEVAKERGLLEQLLPAVNGLGQTALHLAAKRGLENATEQLLRLKVPADAEDKNGFTPSLYVAKDRSSLCCLVAIESYVHYEHVRRTIDQYDEWLNNTTRASTGSAGSGGGISQSNLDAVRKSMSSLVTPKEEYSQRVKRLSFIGYCDNKQQQMTDRRGSSKRKSSATADDDDDDPEMIAAAEAKLAADADAKDEMSTSQTIDSDSELY